MGMFISFNTLGYAVGAPTLNYFFDKTGSYRSSLLALAGLMLVISVVMQMAISSARQTRRALEQQIQGKGAAIMAAPFLIIAIAPQSILRLVRFL